MNNSIAQVYSQDILKRALTVEQLDVEKSKKGEQSNGRDFGCFDRDRSRKLQKICCKTYNNAPIYLRLS